MDASTMDDTLSCSFKDTALCDSKSDRCSSKTPLGRSLWDQAIMRLDAKHQTAIKDLMNGGCNPNELLNFVNQEAEKCKVDQISIYTTKSGRRIFLRESFSRIVGFLDKIVCVGDTLAQYDPGHLSIPWAFARFLLIAAVSDIKCFGAMLESMEIVTGIISRYVIIESIYLKSGLDCSAKLENAIVSLYNAILVYICKARLYFGRNVMVRMGISIFKVEQDAKKLTEEISKEEKNVEKWMTPSVAQQVFQTRIGIESINDSLAEFQKGADERAALLQHALLEMQKPVCRIANHLETVYHSIEASERARIIKWISSLGTNYMKNHRTKSQKRMDRSGQWLLNTNKYRTWLNCSSCSVLWLYGAAGYGKSFLVSLVIDLMMQERQENPHAAPLAYFYCTRDPAEPKRSHPVEILRSIVRQLSCLNMHTPIRKLVWDKWNERLEAESDHGLEIDECIGMLLDLTCDNPAIICIDALDECDRSTRWQLLDAIGTIMNHSKQVVKVFVSSRWEDDFPHYFDKWESLQISATENRDDIVTFVEEELKRSTANRTLLHGNASEKLVSDIKQAMLERADGMFRWVSASLQTLCDPQMILEEEVIEALGKLPQELKEVYKMICSQIESRPPASRNLAEKTMKWLLYANKPLSCNEMINAISADSKSSPASITNETVLTVCSNFVKIDDEIGVFQFVHLSVREYLEEERPEYQTSLCHAAIAQSCLQACLTSKKPKQRANLSNPQNKTFYDYAQVFWPLHCKEAKAQRRVLPLETSFRMFLCNGKYASKQFSDWVLRWYESWFRMELDSRRGAESELFKKLLECLGAYRSANPIFAACVFGFVEVVEDRRQAGVGNEDSKWRNDLGRDPYELAIRYGQEEVIKLLRSDTSLDSTAARESALLSAVSLGEMPMVTMLLNDHLDLLIGEEIMEAAASNCDVTMMKFLVDRYLDFAPTEQLLNCAALNESHGQHVFKFLFEEHGEDLGDLDIMSLLEAACKNSQCGFDVLQFIVDHMDEITVSEEVLQAATENQFDAYQMMRALFKLDKHIAITEDVMKAAACNRSAEPMRLLLSHCPSMPIPWDILNDAARNNECGDVIISMLIKHCDQTLFDEDLMLAAIANQKLAPQLLDILLPKIKSSLITHDVLMAAAQNKFPVDILIGRLLKQLPRTHLHPAVIVAAARNPLYAPEVLQTLLDYDCCVLVTTTALEEAAENPECAAEALERLLLHQGRTIDVGDNTATLQAGLVSDDRSCLVIPAEIVEAAASNAESGSDAMRTLLKMGQNLLVTSKAVETAAANPRFGEEIITLWLANQKTFKVSARAIEKAAGNRDIGPQVSDDALEAAAANPYHGFQMVKSMYSRWESPRGFEQVISSASRNARCGLQIIEFLLKRKQLDIISSDIIESCASSPFANKEMMTVLLHEAPRIPLGFGTVEAAAAHPHHFFDILAVLREHDPNVVIPDYTIYKVVRMTFNIIETIQLLRTHCSELVITEGLLNNVACNANANEATITYLCEFQREQCSGSRELPITEEVLATSLQNSGNGAVSMVRMLLKLKTPRDWDPAAEGGRVAVAAKSYRADAMISVLLRHAEEHGQVFPVTRDALKNAAQCFWSTKVFKRLLKMVPESNHNILNDPEILIAAASHQFSKSPLKLLIAELLGRNITFEITEAVLKRAVKSPQTLRFILKLWSASDQLIPVGNRITEKILEAAALNLSQVHRWGGPEESNFHYLYRFLTEQGKDVPLTWRMLERGLCETLNFPYAQQTVEYFHRIARSMAISFEDLITERTLMSATRCGGRLVPLLLNYIPEGKRKQLMTRDLLASAAIIGAEHCLDFLLQQQELQHFSYYYRQIYRLRDAFFKSSIGKQRTVLRQGTFPNARYPGSGITLLGFAVYHNNISKVRVLLSSLYIDVNTVDIKGKTPLHYACERGFEAVVKLLLAHGADKTVKDIKGKTPEDHAVDNLHFMVARLIREYKTPKKINEELILTRQ